MKKTFTLLLFVLTLLPLKAQTSRTVYVWLNGLRTELAADSITFPDETVADTVEYVDLGLPSGLKWATCNLGASRPDEYGNYYSWGETETKDTCSWDNYVFGGNEMDYSSKYNPTDHLNELLPSDDAATIALGSPWRMPTYEDIVELVNECSWRWTTVNGVHGYTVTGPNGNSIFLPAAGRNDEGRLMYQGEVGNYWTSTLDTSRYYSGRHLYFDNDEHSYIYPYRRYFGLTIRPVRN